jgi:Cu/Ag efflux pump CusA
LEEIGTSPKSATTPLKARIDMLATGIKTPVGIKISGKDLKVIQAIGDKLKPILEKVPGTTSVYTQVPWKCFGLSFNKRSIFKLFQSEDLFENEC